MEIEKLYNDLLEAYSNENLNKITGKLILLYKNRNYRRIREIADKVSKYVPIEEEKDAKCFSRLIMLYHPDRGEQFRKSIQGHYEQRDYENLKMHSHILFLEDIDSVTVTTLDEDIDYHPEYVWDVDEEDNPGYAGSDDDYETTDFERTFYNLIKIREYGNIYTEFPTYYLEDFEELEMAASGLEFLDGVEYCIHVKILDVSNNAISDLENLWDLQNIEELYLANNQIGYIDALSNLIRLRVLDLSGNQVDDISPLFALEHLEYVNLIGNPVPKNQVDFLENKGIIVMNGKMRTHYN